jgi:hypothetical protein
MGRDSTGARAAETTVCVPERHVERLAAASAAAGVTLTEIGTISSGAGRARFLGPDGGEFAFVNPSFSHF